MIETIEDPVVSAIVAHAEIELRTRGPQTVYEYWDTLTPGQQRALDIYVISTANPAIFISKKPEVRFVEWLRAVCYA